MLKIPFGQKLIWLLFGFLWISNLVSGQNLSREHFVKFGEDVNLELVEDPEILISDNATEIPTTGNFKSHPNDERVWFPKLNGTNYWIRIIVNNRADSIMNLVLRYDGYPSSLQLYYRNLKYEWVMKQAGLLVNPDDKFKRSLHGSIIHLNRGIDTIYIYNSDTWRKFTWYAIEFLNPEDVAKGLVNSDNRNSILNYALFAFIILLSFQLLYVIIQAIYHRKIEYREYIFYTITILIYFIIRYELCFNISIITFGEPSLRRLLNDLMLFLPFAFYLRFSRHFIEMPQNYPVMNHRIKLVEKGVLVCAVIFITMFFTDFVEYEGVFSQVLIITLSLISLRLIWFFYRQRDKRIWFILAGSLAATIGHFLGMMSSWFHFLMEIIQMQPIYFTMAGLSFEIFFFNTGLGFKAKSEQQEKIRTQEKLIEQLNANRMMQQKMESMRNRIANDLHDDVGSTLSSIGLYSEVGIDQIDKNSSYVKGILEKIAVSSQRMMTAMNDIVWAIHSRHDEGEGLVERIRYFADERLSPAGIKFNLEIGRDAEMLRFSMEARRNILLIFKEAINNAAKYSGSDSIDCSISTNESSLICSIIDHGKGLNNSMKQGGNGFLTMQSRAAEMNGDFKVIPARENGTAVIFTLPLNEVILSN